MNQHDAPQPNDARATDEALSTRRELFKEFGTWTHGIMRLAAPAALTLAAHTSFAAEDAPSVKDVLRFALTLEYLEAEFYAQALDSGVITDARARTIFSEILAHEESHVTLLENALGLSAGAQKPTFDFSAGGKYKAFEDYATFLTLAQGFEDTGVRAYKGQTGNLFGTDTLRTALRIHSVEARHAAIVRQLRRESAWVQLEDPKAPAPIRPVYAGEEEATQLEVDLVAKLDFSNESVTESFDEPLSKAQVLAIATPFIVLDT